MILPKTADVIIIGGGVMGASSAFHLAKRGVKNIVLLEREEFFGQGATGRCAGGVRYQFGTEINVKLSKISLPMLEELEIETGYTGDYRQCGYLFLLTQEEDVPIFQKNMAMQNSLGVETIWLNGNEIRKMLPLMKLGDVIGGTYNNKDGLADPNSVVMAYIYAGHKFGVSTFNDISVVGMIIENGEIKGVNTTKGSISSPIVLDATGPWAAITSQMAGISVPVQSIRRQMLTTSPLPDIPPDFPFVIDFSKSLYFHREGQGILTGMSNPNENPGFDQNVDPDWELIHLEAATARLPLLENAGLLSHWAGLYEVTPDAHPIFGATPVQGYYLITGFSGHGFMHGPVAGKIMSEIILDGQSKTLDVSSLDLARFREGRLIREYNVV